MAHPAFTSARQTRLLNLYPGERTEDLYCEIGVFSLDELPAYDALSYAWEDVVNSNSNELPEKTEIYCNEQSLPIKANLGRALQYLRYTSHPRKLWIDQVSINQHEPGEKEQQIRYMGEIFNKAQHVVVWLGDSDESTAKVWKLMADLRLLPFAPSQTYHLALGWEPEGFDVVLEGDSSNRREVPPLRPELARLPPADHKSWKCMEEFLARAWFGRVWTLQEVAVSNRCYVVCGEETMRWEDLCIGAISLHIGGYTHVFGAANASIMLRELERQRWHRGARSSLRGLLCYTRSLKTQRAHDKIFGLLPLVNEICSSKLTVQYTRPLVEFFSDVARACIDEDKSLAVLGSVDIRGSSTSEMASWVPDWRTLPPTPIIFSDWSADQRLFQSARGTEPLVLSSPSADTIILRGFLVAPITRVLRVQARLKLKGVKKVPGKLDEMRWRPGVWECIYTRAALDSNMPSSVVRQPEQRDNLSPLAAWTRIEPGLVPNEMLQVALRRTVTGDLYPRPNGRLSESALLHNFPVYSAWEERQFDETPGLPPPQVLWEHDQFVKTTMLNRRAFIAGEDHDAYLGIGLKTLRAGDWVCILYGGYTPFILRPMYSGKGGNAFDVEEWSFVSECYVHDLMDGEAMNRRLHPDFRYQDFVLPSAQSSKFYSSRL